MAMTAGWPGRVAVAVLRGEVPEVFVAEDVEALGRVLAVKLVARSAPDHEIQEALLDERWGDAVALWMQRSGEVIDAYPDEELWTQQELDSDRTAFELRMAPIFQEDDDDPDG
ncbi:MAG: hypothetical protein H0V33_06725 [Acidimicrobiia bacterium]|jgi:hypothetical protein|nr:hypothetical protein [Acidimicrobiia bacterium]